MNPRDMQPEGLKESLRGLLGCFGFSSEKKCFPIKEHQGKEIAAAENLGYQWAETNLKLRTAFKLVFYIVTPHREARRQT